MILGAAIFQPWEDISEDTSQHSADDAKKLMFPAPLRWPTLNMFVVFGFPDGSVGKESACNPGDKGDADSIPGLGRSPEGGPGNPLQYSYLENPHGWGAWQATKSIELDTTEQLSKQA